MSEKKFVFGNDAAIVETDKGKIQGYIYDDIYMFKGIPYAKAERFHRPKEADAWEGVLNTTNYGFVCPLLDSTSKPMGELMVPHRYWIMNEDCLNLNVWTLGCDDKKRPVMVWLHGGGFEAGSSIEQIAYEGENMCKLGDVVVVSVNHRLNVLGFLDLSPFGEEYENSANAGMDDLVYALKWINKNIAKFGGDPENVTLFGQSGGGAKVTALVQMPEADGLFQKGINMSGVIGGLLGDANGTGEEIVNAIMTECKVSSAKELEKVPYDTLASAYLKVRPALQAAGKYVGGVPMKNKYYLGDPNVNGFREETKGVSLMVGSVFGEFASFAPNKYPRNTMTREEGWAECEKELGKEAIDELKPLFEEAYPDRNPIDMLNLDFVFRSGELTYIRKRAGMNPNIYSYIFDVDMPFEGGKTPWHCSDIPYFFHNTCLAPYSQIEGVSDRLEDEIFSRVMAFAHTGNPNTDRHIEWPASTENEEHVLVFGNKETKVKTNYDEKLIPVFEKHMKAGFAKKMSEGNIQH